MRITTVLRSLGADPEEVLSEVGIDPGLLEDPTSEISYTAVGQITARCVAKTGCQHFGLLVGQENGPDSVGLLGVLMHYSTDVESALRNLIGHLHLQIRGATIELGVNGATASLSYDTCEPHVEAVDQINDAAIATLSNMMRALCGPEWRPSAVLFSHGKPVDVGPFRAFFRAPVFFDAEQNVLEFPASWLRYPVPNADSTAHMLVNKQIESLESKYKDDFPGKVRGILRHALLTGHGNTSQVAALFSMHSRTLSRHLRASGTSFHELVDETRFEYAQQALEYSEQDVVQIAAALDYADSSAFTRAFRRWSGTTPARWREQARKKQP